MTSTSQRWVVKIGSALLTDDGRGLAVQRFAAWATQIASLRARDIDFVIVSSGAVAEGLARMGLRERPQEMHKLQAAAAVGQMGLVQTWESHFQQHNLHTAQVLLVGEDLTNRERYLNARKTLNTLLSWGVIPVVNENDTVATEEIRFGDNDTLAALVANLIDADRLCILTDQHGLYDSDPSINADASLIQARDASDVALDAMAKGSAGVLGRGGMISKLQAARLAARSGTDTWIFDGREADALLALAAGKNPGTHLRAGTQPATARQLWLAGQPQTQGRLILDAGASRVISEEGKSLLPVGVASVEGEFAQGDLVTCIGDDGRELARGLVNYSAAEARKIAGLKSADITTVLDAPGDEEIIHRDNLVIL